MKFRAMTLLNDVQWKEDVTSISVVREMFDILPPLPMVCLRGRDVESQNLMQFMKEWEGSRPERGMLQWKPAKTGGLSSEQLTVEVTAQASPEWIGCT